MAGIDVHVDVDVVAPRQFEDAVDLAGVVDVVIGRAADHAGAAFQRPHQGGVGLRRRGQPLLRERADFQIDRPGIFLLQHRQRLDAFGADRQIDLGMGADAGGALLDAVLQRRLGADVDVFDGESRLDRLHPLHVVRVAAARFRRAAVDDAGLVEMDVGLDQPAAAQAALRVMGGRIGLKPWLNGGDLAIREADVDGAVIGRSRHAGVADHVIEHGSSALYGVMRRHSRPKDGVASLAYDQRIPIETALYFPERDGWVKPGHDSLV